METPGSVIDLGSCWHYRLESEIARSTFGIVWQARWVQTGAVVAVKTVRRDRMTAASPDQQALWPTGLRREIDCLGRLRHRHVVCCRHHGEHGGLPVLVLTRLHQSLEQLVEAAGGCLSASRALQIARQVAAGLADLHRYGLRHLDLKPANLLLGAPEGVGPLVKLADFGTARGLCPEESEAYEHVFCGTRGWLAPEQAIPCRDAEAAEHHYAYRTDARSDVYGLGLLLYYLLTGKRTEFSAAALAALSVQPGEAWLRRDLLTDLAAAGLTAQDRSTLARALAGQLTDTSHNTMPDTETGGTWVPGCATRSLRDEPAMDRMPLEALLDRLLAGQPLDRPRDGAAALEAIVRVQYAYGSRRE